MTAPATNSSGKRIWGLLASRPAANRTTTGTSKAAPRGTEFTAIDRLYNAILVSDPNASTVSMWLPTSAGSSTAAGAVVSTGVKAATAGTAVAAKMCINAAGTLNLLALATTDQPNYGICVSTTTYITQGVGNVITAAAAITSGGYIMTDGAGLATPYVNNGTNLKQGLALGDGAAAGGLTIPVLLYRDAIL